MVSVISREVVLDDLAETIHGDPFYFLCSASYEPRCLQIPLRVARDRCLRAIVCENENHRSLHQGHGERLLNHFGERGAMSWLDTRNPLKTGDALFGVLGQMTKPDARIIVDVSTFTHEALLILCRILYLMRRMTEVVFLYSKAEEYSIGDEPAEKWLSKGIGEIRSVLGFPGRVYPSRPLHLLVLVGLEYQRTIDLIGRYEPSSISLGYDDANGAGLAATIRAEGFRRVEAIYGATRHFGFPCFEPSSVMRILLEQAAACAGHNIVVAPMNTKLSTIGVALMACERDDVQICYAQALVYNYQNYSRAGENVVVLSLADEKGTG